MRLGRFSFKREPIIRIHLEL